MALDLGGCRIRDPGFWARSLSALLPGPSGSCKAVDSHPFKNYSLFWPQVDPSSFWCQSHLLTSSPPFGERCLCTVTLRGEEVRYRQELVFVWRIVVCVRLFTNESRVRGLWLPGHPGVSHPRASLSTHRTLQILRNELPLRRIVAAAVPQAWFSSSLGNLWYSTRPNPSSLYLSIRIYVYQPKKNIQNKRPFSDCLPLNCIMLPVGGGWSYPIFHAECRLRYHHLISRCHYYYDILLRLSAFALTVPFCPRHSESLLLHFTQVSTQITPLPKRSQSKSPSLACWPPYSTFLLQHSLIIWDISMLFIVCGSSLEFKLPEDRNFFFILLYFCSLLSLCCP